MPRDVHHCTFFRRLLSTMMNLFSQHFIIYVIDEGWSVMETGFLCKWQLFWRMFNIEADFSLMSRFTQRCNSVIMQTIFWWFFHFRARNVQVSTKIFGAACQIATYFVIHRITGQAHTNESWSVNMTPNWTLLWLSKTNIYMSRDISHVGFN